MTIYADMHGHLPDIDTEAEFYQGVPARRLLAWCIDVVLISLLTLVAVPFTAFTGLFYLPFLYLTVGFLYRWVMLSRYSATLGMQFAVIQIRDERGETLRSDTAFLHILGYTVSMAIFPIQLVSIGLMLTTPMRQGLNDMMLGTAAIRRFGRR